MQTTLRVTTRVQPGHRIEIEAPELAEGEEVTVTVTSPGALAPGDPQAPARGSLWQLIRDLPPGPRSAPRWEEIERELQEDRDSWDR